MREKIQVIESVTSRHLSMVFPLLAIGWLKFLLLVRETLLERAAEDHIPSLAGPI